MDIKNKEFDEVKIAPEILDEIDEFEIRDIKKDNDDLFWIATEGHGLGSFYFRNSKPEEIKWFDKKSANLVSDYVRKIWIDNQSLWLATLDGVSILEKNTWKVNNVTYSPDFEEGISYTSIHDVIKDQSGGVWLATYTGGINYYHPQINLFNHYKKVLGSENTINSNVVHGFWENNKGELFIITGEGGLNKLNRNTGQIKHYTSNLSGGISNNNIKCMTPDGNGNLWIGTYNGLNFFDVEKEEFVKYYHDPLDENSLNHNQIHDVYVDSDGLVWLGLNGGIFQVYDPVEDEFHDFPEVGNIVNVVFEDSHHHIWTAGNFGLNCIDKNTRFLQDLSQLTEGIEEDLNYVTCIFEDSEGYMWFCTSSSGIFVYKNGERYNFNKFNGLNDNTVNALVEDDSGNYWISTNKGISKLIVSGLSDGKPDIYSVDFSVVNGLQGLQFEPGSVYKGKDGMIYFGGVNGYNTFYPDQVSGYLAFPPVVLSELQINFQKITMESPGSKISSPLNNLEELVLKYNERNLQLSFSGVDYVNPKAIHYRYLLTDLDNDWINIGTQRTINFTYLPAGEHELRIQATTNKLEWGHAFRSINIKVLPPWWQTWWSYLLYMAVFLVLLYFFQRWTLLKNKLRLEQFKREKEVELHESKLKFFTDVSHELRTPLTLILAPLEQIMDHGSLNEQLKRQLLYIKRSGIRMMHLIDQVLNLRKLETGNEKLKAAKGNIVIFLNEISFAFSEMALARGVNFEFQTDIEEKFIWYDREKLEIIIYNLLSNAFKNTPEGGTIRLTLNIKKTNDLPESIKLSCKTNECIDIGIVDTGRGIPQEKLKTIFERFYSEKNIETGNINGIGIGLELSKRMVDLHKGKIWVESRCKSSQSEGFTKFSVLLSTDDSLLTDDEKIDRHIDSDDISLYPNRLQISEISSLEDSEQIDNDSSGEYSKEVPTMLVVEDNGEVRRFVKELFAEKYYVEEAENGVEGLKKSIEVVPDIIISDIMMPEMNGIEFCKRLKTDVRISHIPVILLTARSTLNFKLEGLETGADDYVTKPFSAQYLILKVKNLLKQRELIRSHFQLKSLLEPENVKVTSVDEKLLKKAVDYVVENIQDPKLSVERLSAELGLSRMHFYRKIKALTSLSGAEFIRNIRLKRAASLLENNDLSVKEVQNMVGFESADYFRKCFKQQFEYTPSDYQKDKRSSES